MAKQTDSLILLRHAVKGQIYNSRMVNGYPECPICGEPFNKREPSMHEVFMTRAVVMGCPEETQLLIYAPQNTVLVHEGDCHLYAQHYPNGKVLCALQILQYEGKESIISWMDKIDSVMKTRDNAKRTLLEEAILTQQGEANIDEPD